MCFLQKRAESHTETENGGENTQTPTQQRESVRLYMFSEMSVGSNGSLGLSRPKGTQTGPSQPTYNKERAWECREKSRWRLLTWLISTFTQCFTLKRNPREKVKDRGKVLRTTLLSETEPAWDRKYYDVSWREIPPGKGIVRCQVTVLCICEAWNTQEVFWVFFKSCPTVEKANNTHQYSWCSQITFGTIYLNRLKYRIPFRFVQIPAYKKSQHVSNVLILAGPSNPVVLFLPVQGHYRIRLKQCAFLV